MSAPLSITKMSSIRNNFRLLRSISKSCNQCRCINHSSPLYALNRQNVTPNRGMCVDKLDFKLSRSRFCTAQAAERKCWSCGSELEKEKERFFCNCGVVQYVPTDVTFFEIFQCEESFDIDAEKMSKLYKELQMSYHPDRFSQKSKEEREIAESQSAYINKAYNTLLKPLSRGLYLLELRGDPLEETNSSVDPEFLVEIMEINEDIAEAQGDLKAIEGLEAINNKRIKLCVEDISQSFFDGNVSEAKENLIRLKYFTNIEDKIKEIYRMNM